MSARGRKGDAYFKNIMGTCATAVIIDKDIKFRYYNWLELTITFGLNLIRRGPRIKACTLLSSECHSYN